MGGGWGTGWEGSCMVYEIAFPFAHRRASPRCHGIIVNRLRGVGHYQTLINSQCHTESLACRARSKGIVEIEHLVGWLGKYQSVGFKSF